MDKNMMEKLDYYKLKDIVKSYCISSLGKELIDKLMPSENMKTVKRRLDETTEGRNLIDASYHVPLEGISNINSLIDKMDKGSSLEAEDLTKISDFLRGSRKLKQFMKNKEGYAKTLSAYAESISEFFDIEEEINRCIQGSMVSSNASRELSRIRRNIESLENKIKERLDKFLRNSANKECIGEFFVSKRNGRYTIPIKSSYKNKVQGNIVEVSSKGTTVFMEPAAVSKYTSELEMLKAEEMVEEYKILSTLTNMIYDNVRELKINIEIIAEYDMIMAKAKYSAAIEGIQPEINNYGYIKIVNGKYPLIKEPVPLNFEIGKDYRSLIITGPNAGGKTVVLKTVGLLTLAVQSGFHISASKGTEIAVFDNVFVDIGDNQSVTNALSTFSSHVSNLSYILRKSSRNSLLLFDEIGSGTEPNEGAALAIAILEEFYKKGCITVATTHYGEIKNFSENHPDFENAAMEFRKDTLDPLYKLHIGMTGDSNALYISKKMGISDEILKRAKYYIDTKNYNYNKVKESKITKKKEQLDKIVAHYKKGDRVLLLDKNKCGIVYEDTDKNNNVTVYYEKEFIKINYRRIKLSAKAKDLYPEGYDLNQLFTSFKERKLQHDIERGSKKALKKLHKESMKL